jgi:hypothetical protein
VIARISSGVVLVVVGIVALTIANDHRPRLSHESSLGESLGSGPNALTTEHGWSHDAYDAVHIGAWTLVVVGLVVLAIGLLGYAARQRAA